MKWGTHNKVAKHFGKHVASHLKDAGKKGLIGLIHKNPLGKMIPEEELGRGIDALSGVAQSALERMINK